MRNVLVVIGTRPEAIKLAPVVAALRRVPDVNTRVCTTGQHAELLDPVLDLFNIVPDFRGSVMQRSQSLYSLMARVLEYVGLVLQQCASDDVVVQGDTTTALGAALAGFYAGARVAHVEAGLRTGDTSAPFPEEANRRQIATVAHWHFAPTKGARDSLVQEGIARAKIVVTGNTVVDAMGMVLPRLTEGRRGAVRRLLVTVHRRENHGPPLARICEALKRLARHEGVEIVVVAHPNPEVIRTITAELAVVANVRLLAPQPYVQLLELMRSSYVILTDSGGIQEEAPSCKVPVLVLREKTERREAIDAGCARLVGTEVVSIVNATASLLNDSQAYAAMRAATNPFGDGRAAERIVRTLTHGSSPPSEARSTWASV